MAETKEQILELVNKHVIHLYEAALERLKKNGGCYYWSKPEELKTNLLD